MFRNKVDVDRHVAKTLAKVKTEKDRNFRAYSIARLYFDVGDYDSCVRYVSMYLSVKDDNPAAHNLLGQAYHKMGMAERALAEYKASLALDPNQNNLILKVCEILCSPDIPMDAGSARYWAEKASLIFPDHPALFALKANILAAQGGGASATQALLEAETSARPTDPLPHARLLRHLIQSSNIQDSFKYAFNKTFSTDIFNSSPLWNEAVTDALRQSGCYQFGWQYWILRLTVLERLTEISLTEGRGITDATSALWKFDRSLFEASQTVLSLAPTKTLGAEALSHFGGQLCLHAATLMLKKAGQEAGGWREATRMAAPFFLLALQPTMPPKSPPIPASSLAPASSERLLYSWYKEGAYRRSQAGHTLRSCFKDKKNIFVEKIAQYCSGTYWRDKPYRKLFTSREHLEKTNSSYLLTAYELAEVNLQLPKSEDLKLPDSVAGSLKPHSLHNQIWLGINADDLVNYVSFGVEGLRFSVNNLSNCGAETLNKLDVDSFLYCAVVTAKQTAENERKSGYWDPERPAILPAILTPQLCTPAQSKWWMAMWKTGGSMKGDISDVRLTLTRGIETVRCVGSHGLDPELLIEVARIFAKRGEQATESVTQKFLEARANILYSAGVPLLERIRNNISIRPLEKRLFEFTHGELSLDKLDSLIEEGKLYLAVQCINNNDNDKAIEILETIKSPYASYYLYKIFKKLSDEIGFDQDEIEVDNKDKCVLYLTKAKDFLYLTMDRLKAKHDPEHPLYGKLGDHIDNIERALSKLDSIEKIKYNDGYSDEESLVGNLTVGTKNNSLAVYTPRSVRRHRNEVQPSPESLEAQIRQLQKKYSAMNMFVEQAKALVDSNKMVVDEVRDMKKALSNNKPSNIEEIIQNQFKNLQMSVDETVTTRINQVKDENAADVAELKREINELKKELGKLKTAPIERQQQLDESELLMLEEEAGAYFQRQPPAPVIPPQHYPLYPPNALYSLYNQYPGVTQLFPGNLFQDQPLYSDLLAPRTMPQTVPAVVPPIVSTALPTVTIAQPIVQPAITNTVPAVLATPGLTLPEQPPQPIIHNYHIPLPQKATTFQNSTPTKPLATPQANVSTPIATKPAIAVQGDATSTPKPFSFFDTSKANTSDSKPFSFLNASGTFDTTQNKSGLDKSRTVSERSTDSYDPIPDFKPIIELPDEISIVTGEENEEELFMARAKLFRFVDKEWKERGLGNIKLLKNKITQKVRVLMRRERVHNICANHIITSDIEIRPMKEKTYFWAANDFADNELKYEKFSIRFKTVEIGNEFYEKFSKAIADSKLNSSLNTSDVAPTSVVQPPLAPKVEEVKKDEKAKTNVGGLTFFGSPVINKPTEPVTPVTTAAEPAKPGVFANFSFNKTTSLTSTTSSVSVFSLAKTNETPKPEAAKAAGDVKQCPDNVVFETKAKIFTSTNGGLVIEKGQAILRVIKDKEAKVVMSNENDGEIWYDHQIVKGDKFESITKSNAFWASPEAQIVSASDPNITFKVTFTSNDLHKKFLEIATSYVLATSEIAKTLAATTIPTVVSGWGDKFKPKPGSWDCKSCYINNKGADDYCVACNSPKDPSMPKKEEKPLTNAAPTQKFTFGIPAATTTAVEKKEPEKPAVAATTGWGDMFKPKPGSWSCGSCYINNKATDDYCVACNSPKDPSMPKKEDKPSFASDAPSKFSFGIPMTNGGAFAATATSNVCTSTAAPSATTTGAFTFGSTGFTFGMPQQKSDTTLTPSKALSFGDSAFAFTPATTTATTNPATFPQKNTFQFTLKTKSPGKDNKDASLNKSHESDNEYVSEDDGDHLVFAPVVPLPNKVEVKTGEEDEAVLYVHRAKLYRFADGEWKECGVGDIKILKHPQTNKLRVLMRREPINKICLNHILNNDIKYISKDEKSWLFFANDFSKEELTPTQFCVRFKNKTIAEEFMSAADKARSGSSDSVVGETKQKSDGEEVVFVSETMATKEEKEKAKGLMLPENFYNYKYKEPCKGCIGCDPETYKFSEITCKPPEKEQPKVEVKKTESKPFVLDSKSGFTHLTTSSGFTPVSGTLFSGTGNNSFGALNNSTSLFGTPKPAEGESKLIIPTASTPQQTTTTPSQGLFSSNTFSIKPGESVFGNKFGVNSTANTQSPFNLKPPAFGASTNLFGTNQNSLFKAPTATTTSSSPSATQAVNLFSQAAKAQESSPAFGAAGSLFGKAFGNSDGKSIFGNANSTPETKSIFGGTGETKGFASLVATPPTAANPENGEKEQNIFTNFSASSDLSFSGLAEKTKEVPFVNDQGKSFTWAGAGAPVFGAGGLANNKSLNSSKGNVKDKSAAGDENEDGQDGATDENYDPHYEPIVPMPDEIKVVTGEEDEKSIYEHRAKLYRFTTEWKERGTGDIKLLFHPEKKSYRLLLRQSQVHKTVLNQRVTRDLQMAPMSKSDRALMWAGMNYTEDNPEGVVEKLAVRFSNPKVMEEFLAKVTSAVEELKAVQLNASTSSSADDSSTVIVPADSIPTTVQNKEFTPATQAGRGEEEEDEEQVYEEEGEEYRSEEDEEDGYEDYYGDYDEDDLNVEFESEAQMNGETVQLSLLSSSQGGGHLRVYHTDYDTMVSDTYVVDGAIMQCDGTVCKWRGVDEEDEWKIATLPDEDMAIALHASFQDLL